MTYSDHCSQAAVILNEAKRSEESAIMCYPGIGAHRTRQVLRCRFFVPINNVGTQNDIQRHCSQAAVILNEAKRSEESAIMCYPGIGAHRTRQVLRCRFFAPINLIGIQNDI
jgi:hypothetical protein